MLRLMFAMARKDLALTLARGSGLVQALLLGLLLLFVFSLSQGIGERMAPQGAAAVFWISSAFCQVLIFNQLYALEEVNNSRLGLLLCPAPVQAVWLGKGCAGLALLLLAQLVFLPAAVVFLGQDLSGPLPEALLALLLTDIGMCALGSLLGALAQGQAARESLLSIVLFPLLTPLLLAGISVGAQALGAANPDGPGAWLGVAAAFDAGVSGRWAVAVWIHLRGGRVMPKCSALPQILALLGGVAFAACQWLVFAYAPEEVTLGLAQKIFYIHLPMSWWALVSFLVVFGASVAYLWRRNPAADRLAAAAAEVGVLLGGLALVTGMLWARRSWGVWWTWDPRLTTTLIMWFVYAGYLVLRGLDLPPQRRNTVCAVVGVVAFLDVPLVFMSARIWRSIHPAVFGSKGGGLEPEMRVTVMACVACFGLLWAALVWLRKRQLDLRDRLDALAQNRLDA